MTPSSRRITTQPSARQRSPYRSPAGAQRSPDAPVFPAEPPPGGAPGGEPSDQSPLEQGWSVLKRRKWVVLQALVIIPLVVFALTLMQEERFEATATLLFQDPTLGVLEGEGSIVDPDRAAATNVDLASLPVVAERAAEELEASPQEVHDKVAVEASETSDIADVEATSSSPQRAAATANAYAEAYIEFRRESSRRQLESAISQIERQLASPASVNLSSTQIAELRNRLDQLRLAASLETGDAELVQRASPPSEPSSPDPRRNMILGFALAIAVAAGLAALLERVDRGIRDIGELERLYDLPVLARIPRSKALAKPTHSLTDLSGRPAETEAFRTLRANLGYFNVDGRLDSVLVASPLAGDGKSTIASLLAMVMASMGDRVILVETDLHKGMGDTGLSSVLAGRDLDEALTEIELPVGDGERKLAMLPGGPPPPNPYEMLESDRMAELLNELEEQYDLVMLDSPALSAVSDALALVPRVSGVLIVSALGHTPRDAALDLRKQLMLAQGHPLGVVANFSTPERGGYRYYAYSGTRTGTV